MSTEIGPEGDWQVKSSTDGEGSDCCPNCGSRVEAEHVLGDPSNPFGYIYGHNRKEGGCGATWNRTTALGMTRANGYDPKWPVTGVAVGRTVSTPSRAYRNNYEAVFGHA